MKPLQIGITGGIGSGKSLICRILDLLKIPVFNADEVSKKLLDTDQSVIDSVIALLGPNAYPGNGKADRIFIAGIVFNNPEKLQSLNAILHPAVQQHYINWVSMHNSSAIVAKEAAIMFESGSNKGMDHIIAVTAPEALRIERVQKRDGKSIAEVHNIIKQQLAQDEIIKRSDFCIVNDDQHLIIPQILDIISKIKSDSN